MTLPDYLTMAPDDIREAASALESIARLKASGAVFKLQPPDGMTVEESCRNDVCRAMRLRKMADRAEDALEVR